MPLALLPRPSLITSAVVALSVASGLAFGLLAATTALVVHRVGRR